MITAILSLFLIGQAVAQPAATDIPGCVYISGGVTLTTKQTTVVQCDQNGKLLTR